MSCGSHLAIDIGASGGRSILGWLDDSGRICTQQLHRFPNDVKQIDGHTCWDIEALFNEVICGLKKCALAGKIPDSVGIDTWGVDYVLLDKNGSKTRPAVAYRDSRTDKMDIETARLISDSELYSRSGLQKMFFNTIYQLMGAKKQNPRYFDDAAHLLFIPDYLHYRLSGVMKNEYTISSTSGLLNAKSKTWDDEIIKRCGFPREIFGELVPAGTVLGGFTPEVRDLTGFDCKVIMPPSHDTASAFLAVPAKAQRSVYISSGTWSLMGAPLPEPIGSEESRLADFTNEGGFEYRYRYLKNIAGLWLLQSVKKEIAPDTDYAELVSMARASKCDSLFNVNDESFAAPESMVKAILSACRGQNELPQTPGDFARCIFRSLAASYAATLESLKELTGIKYDSINIIGGGSQNDFLNELTAKACNLPVYAGPTEGTALGNITCQMISLGILPDSKAAKDTIRKSFDIKEVLP